jgi:nucleoside-diphosphate-sugar epimerase
MKVAITGASGFIGARLAQLARSRGHEVVALGRVNNDIEAARVRALEAAGVHMTDVDINDGPGLQQALAGVDLVFHLAAAQHEANVGEDYFRRINVDGTRTLLEAAVAAGVSRFIHGSTIGVYGSAASGELDESSPTRPDNMYGVTKLEGERVALSFNDRIPVTAIRISETYGPGDNRLLKLFKAVKKGRFFMIGSGLNVRQLIFVDDLVDGMFRAAERGESAGEVYVLAGAEILTTRQTAETIADALGVRPGKLRVPMWPFLLLAILMEKTMRPLGLQPPLHRRRLDFFRKSFYFSLDKSRKELGFTPRVSFAEGSRLTARAYEESGVL